MPLSQRGVPDASNGRYHARNDAHAVFNASTLAFSAEVLAFPPSTPITVVALLSSRPLHSIMSDLVEMVSAALHVHNESGDIESML